MDDLDQCWWRNREREMCRLVLHACPGVDSSCPSYNPMKSPIKRSGGYIERSGEDRQAIALESIAASLAVIAQDVTERRERKRRIVRRQYHAAKEQAKTPGNYEAKWIVEDLEVAHPDLKEASE